MKKKPTTIRTAQASPKGKFDELYARLEKAKPGSEESKRVSEQILEAIFDTHGPR